MGDLPGWINAESGGRAGHAHGVACLGFVLAELSDEVLHAVEPAFVAQPPQPFNLHRAAPQVTGKIEDAVFTDAKFGFQLTLPEGWTSRTRNLDDPYRLVMIQKN